MVSSDTYTKDEILELLSEIKDPEIPVVSIQEMGMLRDVMYEHNHYTIIITPTYTACPAMGIIQHDILSTLKLHGISNASVKLVYTPAWTSDWMSPSTKEKLKQYGIAAPLHSNCANAFHVEDGSVACPRCNSFHTKIISRFGSTACKALFRCNNCMEPFEYFKCH